MIAQDYMSIRISISTYNNKYLDYIFGQGDASIIPPSDEGAFLEIQEIGPFDIEDREQANILVIIVLSLLLCQLEPTSSGDLVRSVLHC